MNLCKLIFILSCILSMNLSRVKCDSGNILMMFDKPGTSHFHDAVILAKLLQNRGYNVSFLIPERFGNSSCSKEVRNTFSVIYSRISYKEDIDFVDEAKKIKRSYGSLEAVLTPFKIFIAAMTMFADLTNDLLLDVEMADDIMTSQFDMVVVEGSFHWYLPLVRKLNIPYAMLTTSCDLSTTNVWFNVPKDCTVLPATLLEWKDRKHDFFWRIENCSHYLSTIIFFLLLVNNNVLTASSSYMVNPTVGPMEIFALADVWMTNTDFAADLPRAYLPSTVMIGGMSIDTSEGLSKTYQNVIEQAGHHGVIIVSMGNEVKKITQDQSDAMALAFARLPQTVIWKEIQPSPRFIGNNTIIESWIPQKQLLAHPKVRAMVSHCGNNGAFEALYHGVPIVAIPVYADQHDIAYRVKFKGIGVAISLPSLTEEKLYSAISEVINDSKYSNRAKHLSAIYRDISDPASERAAYWVEYILRHGGNQIRKDKISRMGFIKRYLLDVYVIILTLMFFLLILVKKLISCFVNLLTYKYKCF